MQSLITTDPPPFVERRRLPARPAVRVEAAAPPAFEAMLAAFDGLAFGLAVVDEAMALGYANAAAVSLFASAGWSLRDGVLRSGLAGEQALWAEALAEVCHDGRRRLVELQVGDDPVYAALAPLSAGGRAQASVTFGRLEICSAVELQLFAKQCRLTGAESLVLEKIAAGRSVAEIASEHGVEPSTVATQAAAIRDKTGCRSVRALLEQLSCLPALRPLGQGAGIDRLRWS